MIGTRMDVSHFLEDGESEDDPVLTEAIDSEIFCCSTCEWWCELSKAADGKDCCADCDDEECE